MAGHRGMVGSAIFKYLLDKGYTNLIIRTTETLDLREQVAVNDFFAKDHLILIEIAAWRPHGLSRVFHEELAQRSTLFRMEKRKSPLVRIAFFLPHRLTSCTGRK